MKILLVEDDVMLAQAVERILEVEGYSVDVAHDGETGLSMVRAENYDAMILDVMLPRKSGIAVVSEMRDEKNQTPVLMLTAMSSLSDKINGLDSGADDYMTKPFAPAEMLAHLRALLRRNSGRSVDGTLNYAGLSLDPASHELSCEGRSIGLSAKEHGIMEMLMGARGKTVSKDEIIAGVWGPGSDISGNSVEAYVSLLRKKMTFIEAEAELETIRKAGYRIAG